MERKVERLAKAITEAISRWDTVECVTIGEHSETDALDPNFALVLDVYLRGSPPTVEERQHAFAQAVGQPGAFESAISRSKDRFFIDEIPIRVEYKNLEMIDDVIGRSKGADSQLVWVLKNSGTYIFYRIKNSRVLYEKSDWIDRARRDIGCLPEGFWDGLRLAFMAKMEHYLSDLGAASFNNDGYFYSVSLAGFLRYAAASLFMANRRLEPSNRYVNEQLRTLPKLPGDFPERWEALLRTDTDLSGNQRKYKLAELLALSIISLK
jgi:hypothetical protein